MMKEIFNDIRCKASLCSDKACFMPDDTEVITESRLKQILDEAEAEYSDIEQDAYERGYKLGFDNGYKDGAFFEKAKWEAECCEYKHIKGVGCSGCHGYVYDYSMVDIFGENVRFAERR